MNEEKHEDFHRVMIILLLYFERYDRLNNDTIHYHLAVMQQYVEQSKFHLEILLTLFYALHR